MLTPSFHFKFLENSVSMVYENAQVLCDKIEAEANGKGFDIEQYIEKSTLDIICGTFKLKAKYGLNRFWYFL